MIKNMTHEILFRERFSLASYCQPALIEILTRRITVYKTNQFFLSQFS